MYIDIHIHELYGNDVDMMWNTRYNLKQYVKQKWYNTRQLFIAFYDALRNTKIQNTHLHFLRHCSLRLLSAFAVLLRWRGSRNTGGLGESRFFRQVSFFGCLKWPFQGLSDLPLGDRKVTLEHLDGSKWPDLIPQLESEVMFSTISRVLSHVLHILRDPAFFDVSQSSFSMGYPKNQELRWSCWLV